MADATYPTLEELAKMSDSEQSSIYARLRKEIATLSESFDVKHINRRREKLKKLEQLKLQYQNGFLNKFSDDEDEEEPHKKQKKKEPCSSALKTLKHYRLELQAKDQLIAKKEAEVALRRREIQQLVREQRELRQEENRRRAELGLEASDKRLSDEVRCGECQKIVLKSKFARHQALHKEKPQFACDECDAMYSRADNLKRHCKLHRFGRTFKCPKCGDAFERQNQLTVHVSKCLSI